MFNVTCESICDLTYDYLQSRNCPVLFYTYSIDGEEFEDNMGRDENALAVLYDALKTKRPTTSQINTEKYADFFRQQLQKGDVLHLTFSSGLTQSISNCYKAAEEVRREFPSRKLVVVDSLSGGGGLGLIIEHALDMRDNGATLEEIATWVEQNKLNVQHYFFTTDLSYLRRSGRVSGPAMLIGNLLHLCPLMRVTSSGRIVAYNKTITARKAIAKLVEEMGNVALDGYNYNGTLFLEHSNCLQTALQTKQAIQAAFPNLTDIRLVDIGTILACHCGPNTVALFFWGNGRFN